MSGKQRREQLLDVGRALFAERGFEGTSVEEIASRAKVSKPVVYEHFGGKEGLYAVVVDREMRRLLDSITTTLGTEAHPRKVLERAALALLDYIEQSTDGFRILVRDSPVAQSTGTFASLISDAASQVEHMLASEFKSRGFDPKMAPMYSQMLVGMVALTGQWWLDERKPRKADVAAHLVNLAWNGLGHLELKPKLSERRELGRLAGDDEDSPVRQNGAVRLAGVGLLQRSAVPGGELARIGRRQRGEDGSKGSPADPLEDGVLPGKHLQVGGLPGVDCEAECGEPLEIDLRIVRRRSRDPVWTHEVAPAR